MPRFKGTPPRKQAPIRALVEPLRRRPGEQGGADAAALLAKRRRLILDAEEEAATLYNIDDYAESFSQSFVEDDLSALAIDSTGTYMYMFEDGGSYDIKSYTLSTAWDISTATATGDEFVIGSGFRIRGMWVTDDGQYLYCTPSSSIVRRYTMSTPWDISTCGSLITKDFSGTANAAQEMIVSADGTRFWLMANNGLEINEYELSTPFDITTAGAVVNTLDISVECTEPRSFMFDGEGFRVYVVDSTDKKIYQYNLSTAYDLSTGVAAANELSVSSQVGVSIAYGLHMKPDNTRFFMVVNFPQDQVTAFDVS